MEPCPPKESEPSARILAQPLVRLLLGILFLAPAAASATDLERLSLERLSAASSHVVTGRCTGLESGWTEDRRMVYTRAEFLVEEVIQGEMAGDSITVLLPGGTADGLTTIVVGAPGIAVGDEAVLMLRRVDPTAARGLLPIGAATFHVVGLSQGKFDLTADPISGQRTARSNALEYFSGPDEAVGLLPPGGVEGMPLDLLRSTVRQAVARRPARTTATAEEGQESEDEDERGDPAAAEESEEIGEVEGEEEGLGLPRDDGEEGAGTGSAPAEEEGRGTEDRRDEIDS